MTTDLPDSYKLTRAQLLQLITKMDKLPVTYEHSGIHAAVDSLRLSSDDSVPPAPAVIAHTLDNAHDPKERSFGCVVDTFETKMGAFCAIMDIDVTNKPNIHWSIVTRQLGSVSLTHCTLGDGSLLPLELSIVSQPARPKSDIIFRSSNLNDCLLYKGRLQNGTISHTEIMSSAEGPKTCAEVLQALPEPQRLLIAARLEELVRVRDASEERLVAANKQLKEASAAQQTDHAVMKGQLETLFKRLPQEMLANFGIPDNVGDLSAMFQSETPHQTQQAALRTIMCANHALMMQEMKGAPATPVPVVAASTAMAVDPAPQSVAESTSKRAKPMEEKAAESTMSLLERALTEQFEN